MQLIWHPPVADDQYVAECAWERAVLDECPFHAGGGCGARGHGSYPREHPVGVRVPRFLCPVLGVTISLLPAFLACRLPGTLDEVESVIDLVEREPSIAADAEVARPAADEQAVTSISAARWVHRRLRPVVAVLLALVTLLPELTDCRPTLAAIHVHYVVTEHGIADLHGLNLRQRAETLIAIAHPEFRAELRRQTLELRRFDLGRGSPRR